MDSLRYVVDASVIVKWLDPEREPNLEQAMYVLELGATRAAELFTSDLAPHETFNALIRGKHLSGKKVELALENFFLLPLEIVATSRSRAGFAVLLAQHRGITFYDAIYLAVADELRAPLITANPKHQQPLSHITVIPLEKFAM